MPSPLRSSGQKPKPSRIACRGDRIFYSFAAHLHLSAVGMHRAEQQFCGFGPPRAEQAGKPDHLAVAHGKVERRHEVPPSQALGGDERRARRRRGFRRALVHGMAKFAAQHQRDQRQSGKLRRRRGADHAPVAQHRDAVGDRKNLVDEVGDEHDRDAAPLQLAQDAEQQLDFARIEAGRGLVEHQHARVAFERAGDRDELLDRHRIGAERALDVDVEIEPRERRAGPRAGVAPGDQAEPPLLVFEREVFCNRQRRHQVEFLVDGADAERLRGRRAVDLDRLAVQKNLAGVAVQRAGHDLDQRRLAGTVLAEQRMHFAGVQAEIDAFQRAHAGKPLDDPTQFDPRFRHGGKQARGAAPGSRQRLSLCNPFSVDDAARDTFVMAGLDPAIHGVERRQCLEPGYTS